MKRFTLKAARIAAISACAIGSVIAGLSHAQTTSEQQVLFTNVNTSDGHQDNLIDAGVLVRGNLIEEVGAELDAPGARVIDGGGRALTPGMIDAHVHLNMHAGSSLQAMENATWHEIASVAVVAAREYLDSGFTTVSGMGSVGGWA